MEANHAQHVPSRDGQIQHARAAEAVSDGRNFARVSPLLLLGLHDSRMDTVHVEGSVAVVHSGKLSIIGLSGVGGEIGSVDVSREGVVAQLGQHLHALHHVFAEAGPGRDHHNDGEGGGEGGVIRVISREVHRHVHQIMAVSVVNVTLDDGTSVCMVDRVGVSRRDRPVEDLREEQLQSLPRPHVGPHVILSAPWRVGTPLGKGVQHVAVACNLPGCIRLGQLVFEFADFAMRVVCTT
mmetsp:Transcript_4877/g.8440  ORF Transcript_4877/g.8440 Transcript_4877/m.8440 type:complete len:238 (-) Transcript_4877:718-1431(-)